MSTGTLVGVLGLVLGIGLGLVGIREASANPEAPVAPQEQVVSPTQRIADQGRLSVTIAQLREGAGLALALDLSDELRGRAARPVKIIDIAGRVLETSALPIVGSGTGLRLELDPEWLRPGHYLIQVETAEQRPLALRRYVLEVREKDSSDSKVSAGD